MIRLEAERLVQRLVIIMNREIEVGDFAGLTEKIKEVASLRRQIVDVMVGDHDS